MQRELILVVIPQKIKSGNTTNRCSNSRQYPTTGTATILCKAANRCNDSLHVGRPVKNVVGNTSRVSSSFYAAVIVAAAGLVATNCEQ